MKMIIFFLSIIFLMTTTACNNPFGGRNSRVDSSHLPGVDAGLTIDPAKDSEFVSSSQQSTLTSGGRFKVSASLASPAEGVYLTTTSRGYKLFSNVQGELVSQESE